MNPKAIDFVYKIKNIKPQERCLLHAIAYCMKEGESDCSPPSRELHKLTGLSNQMLTKWRGELKDTGILSIGYQRGAGGNNIYSIVGFGGASTDTGNLKINKLIDDFDRFWATYPKKQAKRKALAAWMKKRPTPEQVSKAITHIEHMVKTKWDKDNYDYIPLPTSYINAERWDDEIVKGEERSEYAFL